MRAEKINWQEDWKENEEDCDTAFDIWRKSYSKKSEGEMWIGCKRPNSTENAAKDKKKITLTKKHKGARLECAKRLLTKHVDFKKVIFTDENNFKFDGPDGWYTWSRWVSLLYWTNDKWEEEELLFGVWSLLMEMVGVAERTTEQRKLQIVAGRESTTKDKKRDGEWFPSTASQLQHPCVKTHERMDG